MKKIVRVFLFIWMLGVIITIIAVLFFPSQDTVVNDPPPKPLEAPKMETRPTFITIDGHKVEHGMLADDAFPILKPYSTGEDPNLGYEDGQLFTITHYYSFNKGKIDASISFMRTTDPGPYRIFYINLQTDTTKPVEKREKE